MKITIKRKTISNFKDKKEKDFEPETINPKLLLQNILNLQE